MKYRYKYKLLNYWNDEDTLYVNYTVEDLITSLKANVIDDYDVCDLDCNYNTSSHEEISNSIYRLIEKNEGKELKYPLISQASPLLQYVYNEVCESESNMCHIDYYDWEDLKKEYDFDDNDILKLKEEIEMYNLKNYITIDDGEYMICGYGGLQCRFNDDRNKGSDELER